MIKYSKLVISQLDICKLHVELQMGFFAEAGPVQIFVSNHVRFIPYFICVSQRYDILLCLLCWSSIGSLKLFILYPLVRSVAFNFYLVVYFVQGSRLSLFLCLRFITYLFQPGNKYSFAPINVLYSSSICKLFLNFFYCFLKAF